jgi:hypothetical protein
VHVRADTKSFMVMIVNQSFVHRGCKLSRKVPQSLTRKLNFVCIFFNSVFNDPLFTASDV